MAVSGAEKVRGGETSEGRIKAGASFERKQGAKGAAAGSCSLASSGGERINRGSTALEASMLKQ